MSTVTVVGQIAAPVERVFGVFTDLEQSAGRVSNIQKIDVLTIGGFKLGTRWLETREVLGQPASAEMEVTAFERNRAYTITHHKAGTRIDTSFKFEPADQDTRIQIDFMLDSGGAPPGLLAPVGWAIAAQVRQVIVRDLADLKDAVETPLRLQAPDGGV
jgi:hypothetical protein